MHLPSRQDELQYLRSPRYLTIFQFSPSSPTPDPFLPRYPRCTRTSPGLHDLNLPVRNLPRPVYSVSPAVSPVSPLRVQVETLDTSTSLVPETGTIISRLRPMGKLNWVNMADLLPAIVHRRNRSTGPIPAVSSWSPITVKAAVLPPNPAVLTNLNLRE